MQTLKPMWGIRDITPLQPVLFIICLNASTNIFWLKYIWVYLQYSKSQIHLHISLFEIQLKIAKNFIWAILGPYKHILNDCIFLHKQIWVLRFFVFFWFFFFSKKKKCTIDFYRSTMMSLSEMHNMVTCAYSHRGRFDNCIRKSNTCKRKCCTMHRYRLYVDNL